MPDRSVRDGLTLSVRTRNSLARVGITTIGQVLATHPDEMLQHRKFGETSLRELRDELLLRGYDWFALHRTADASSTGDLEFLTRHGLNRNCDIRDILLATLRVLEKE